MVTKKKRRQVSCKRCGWSGRTSLAVPRCKCNSKSRSGTDSRYTDHADKRRIFDCVKCGWSGVSALRIPRCKCGHKITDPERIRPM